MSAFGRMVTAAADALRPSHLNNDERVDVALALASEIDDPAKLAELVRRAARLQTTRRRHPRPRFVRAKDVSIAGEG